MLPSKLVHFCLLFLGVVLLAQFAGNISTPVSSQLAFSLGAFSATTTDQLPTLDLKENTDESILFTGDVMLGRHVETLIKNSNPNFPFEYMKNASSTYVVGNFEAAIPAIAVHTPDLNMQLAVNQDFLAGAKDFGFTHFGLANNHTFDFGIEGYVNTERVLSEAGFTPFGGNDLATTSLTILKVNDISIALVALYGVETSIDTVKLQSLLEHQAASTTYQIAYIHWGDEYKLKHSPEQQKVAESLIDSGFDAIIGHHPHVVQDISYYQGKPIFYSLGNFVFDQYFSTDVQQGLLLSLKPTLTDLNFTFLPVTSVAHRSQPTLMNTLEKSEFLLKLAKRSSEEVQLAVISGNLIIENLVAFPEKSASITKN